MQVVQAENNTLLFREEQGDQGGTPVLDDEIRDQEDGPKAPIRCRACGATVTENRQRITVSGSHRHTFFNPAGIVFELGCFQRAPGCSVAGPPSSEFTWFAGHVWRFALCASCRNHLGWFFEGAGKGFFGLILNKLS